MMIRNIDRTQLREAWDIYVDFMDNYDIDDYVMSLGPMSKAIAYVETTYYSPRPAEIIDDDTFKAIGWLDDREVSIYVKRSNP